MNTLKLSNVSSKYGAPMGRADRLPDDPLAPIDLQLARLPMVDGDYDEGGAYWGGPCDAGVMWCAWREGVQVFCRAVDATEAQAKVRAVLPGAQFDAPAVIRTQKDRQARLLPRGVPRYVRCYDDGRAGDRYTVCFTGRSASHGEYPYVAMSASPFHPQGIGQHGTTKSHPCDVNCNGWPPAMGRKNHLGTRIRFQDLPADCRKLVLRDYKEIWGLK